MEKIVRNYRYWLLLVIGTVAFICTFAVPNDDTDLLTFIWVIFSTKAIGFGGFYLMGVLIRHWEKRNSIPELTQFAKEF